MSSSPTAAADRTVKASLTILRPPPPNQANAVIPLQFNPTELRRTKANTFADIPIPGLDVPLLQFVRGGSETLTVDALVDTSDTLEDVHTRYIARLRALMAIDGREHAPPIVSFGWGSTTFVGVMESLDITYLLFTPRGIPLRARLAMSLKQYMTADEQAAATRRQSPTVEKSYVVRRGDTLAGISQAVYRTPENWRVLADENGIVDPRTLTPGTVLVVPPLDTEVRP